MKVCSDRTLWLFSLRFFALVMGLGIPLLVSGCGGGGSSTSGSGSSGSGGGGNTTPTPAISSISPTSVSAGSNALTLTMSGSGFLSTSVVEVNSISESTTFVSSTELTATVPASQLVSGADLTVVVSNGSLTSGSGTPVDLEVDNPAPAITSVSPTTEPTGTASPNITVTGTGFVPTTVINVNGATRTTTFTSSTQISVTLSTADVSTAGSLSLAAVNSKPGGGTSTTATVAIVAPNPVPTVSTLDPATELVGTESANVVVAGTGFVSSTVINVSGSSRPTSFTNSTQVSVTLTSADLSATGSLSLTAVNPAPGGGMSVAIILPVNNPPIGPIQLNPSTVAVGSTSPTTITVTGNTFVANSAVKVNGNARSTTYVNSTTLKFVATVADEADSGILAVAVTNPPPGGGTSPAANLTIGSGTPTPVITSISPNSITPGSPDTTIAVLGTGFTSGSVVQWNGANLNTSVANGNGTISLQATVPAADLTSVGTATVKVDTPSAIPSLSNALTVNITNPAPTLTSISPSAGPINTAVILTLTGTGFTPNSMVAYNGTTVPVAYVSSTSLTATLPASRLPGSGSVTVTTPAPGGGSSASLTFTGYIAIANNGMVYSPTNGLLYISVPSSAGPPYGNSVVPVDPVTGGLGAPIFVGSEPDKLALTSDGKYLWVSLDGAYAVRKVDLTANTAGLQFTLMNSVGASFSALALAALPGASDSVVVSLEGSGYGSYVNIYDSGTPRANAGVSTAYESYGYGILADATPDEIYVAGPGAYTTYSYDGSGLTPKISNTSNSYDSYPWDGIQIVGGALYADNGSAFDAESGNVLGTFYSSGTLTALGSTAVDATLGKTFILEGSPYVHGGDIPDQIQVFNTADYSLASDAPIPFFEPVSASTTVTPPSALVRWDLNGLAFRTSYGVFSLRSNLVKDLSSVSADLGVTLSSSGSNVTGSTTTFTATVTNAGPSPATNVALSSQVPSTGTLSSAVPSSGTCSTFGGTVCSLGSLASGASANVVFTVNQLSPGPSTFSVQVTGSENDPVPANNQASATITLTGSDYSPAPSVSSVSPAAIAAGSSDTTITVTGTGFDSGSSILLNGNQVATTLIGSTQLSANVPAASLTKLSWIAVSVATTAPGGGTSSTLPLSVYSVMTLGANHILYDPFSRKIMASIGPGTSTITGNSILAITPETGSTGNAVPIGDTPTDLALTQDGQILYALLTGSASIARFNMLTQQPDFTVGNFQATGYNVGLRDIATQPGSENTVAVDEGEYIGIGIYDFDPASKTATKRGGSTGTYTGTCLAFSDADHLFAMDLYSSPSSPREYTVTANGLLNGSYPYYVGTALEYFNCYKVAGGFLFSTAGGIATSNANPVQVGVFPGLSNLGTYGYGVRSVEPDTSLQEVFFTTNSSPYSYAGTVDSITIYDQNTFLPLSVLPIAFSNAGGNSDPNADTNAVDLVRWGQDGLAALTTSGQVYLLRGPAVVPQLLNQNMPAVLTSSSMTTISHGSGNTVLTLTGSNFVPGVAVTWNGGYRTTTIVDGTHVTVAIPASDLVSTGTASLVATNPGGPASTALQISIN